MEKNEKPIAMTLAALVFLAGAATAGVALAGYLPYHYFYAGIGIIAVELVLVGVCLAISYCNDQKNSSHSIVEEQPDDQSYPVNSAQSESESSEADDVEPITEVNIKEPNQKCAPLDTCWLPAEVWVHIFSYLKPKELSSAFLTCRSWNQWVQTDSLWSRWILEQDWHEDKPECFKVWRQIHSLKADAPRNVFQMIFDPGWWSFPSCSGNHCVLYCDLTQALEVWKIEKGNFSKSSQTLKMNKNRLLSLGYSNKVVHILTQKVFSWDLTSGKTEEGWIVGGYHIFADRERIMVSGNHYLGTWNKKTAYQSDAKNLDVGRFLVYKNKLIFQTPGGNSLKLRDLKSNVEEEIITFQRAGEILFFVSGDVLVIQNFPKSHNDTTLYRYDLVTKKWFSKINPEMCCRLMGALGGLIITKQLGSTQAKIFDFRHEI